MDLYQKALSICWKYELKEDAILVNSDLARKYLQNHQYAAAHFHFCSVIKLSPKNSEVSFFMSNNVAFIDTQNVCNEEV